MEQVSYECYFHGYMGGQDNLKYSTSCSSPSATPQPTSTPGATPNPTPNPTPSPTATVPVGPNTNTDG